MKKLLPFLLLLVAFQGSYGQNYILQQNWWLPNNAVRAIVKDTATNTVYAGGDFDYWGTLKAYGTAVDLVTGQPDFGMAGPNAIVDLAVADGVGGVVHLGSFYNGGRQCKEWSGPDQRQRAGYFLESESQQ